MEYNAEERAFAETLRTSLPDDAPPLESAAEVEPLTLSGSISGSTDVGDVSWTVPTAGLATATWVPGTAAHSWQAVAAGGTTIGNKGMMVAAKTLATTAVDLFNMPDVVRQAWTEHEESRGDDYVYIPLVGDRDPPLDYRLPAGSGR